MSLRARGEVSLTAGGETLTLCLTLGALAEIEDAFGSLEEFAARLKTPRASDLTLVLAALLRGGGDAQAAQAIQGLKINIAEASAAIAAAFAAAGLGQEK